MRSIRAGWLLDAPATAYLIFIVGSSIPFQWVDYWRVAGIPGINVVYVGVLVLVAALLNRSVWNPLFLFGIAVFIYATLLGFVNRNSQLWSSRYFIIDLLYISSIFIGYILGKRTGSRSLSSLIIYSFRLSVTILAVTTVAIWVGLLNSTIGGSRFLDPAQYSSLHVILVLMPLVVCVAPTPFSSWAAVYAGSSVCLAFAISSSTRSSFLLSIFMGLASGYLAKLRNGLPRLEFLLGAVLVSVAGAGYVVSTKNLSSTELAYRFQAESLEEDSRWTEIEAMFAQMAGDIFVGKGAGSGFFSPILVASEQEDRGLAPHFGYFTWLLKGGVIATIWYSVLLISLLALAFQKNLLPKAIALGALYSLLVSLSSGGYGLIPLSLLGLLWGLSEAHKKSGSLGFVAASETGGVIRRHGRNG